MLCPRCGKQMLEGYIHNGRGPVSWLPKDEKPPLFIFQTNPASVLLNNEFRPSLREGYRAESHFCQSCRFVLSPLAEPETEQV